MKQTVSNSLGGSRGQSTESPLAVAIVIDVEPDRVVGLEAVPWRGFEAGAAMAQDVRREFSERWGAPVTFNWMLRADLQIAEIYGSAGWMLERYGEHVERLAREGDFFGLHVHPIREADRIEDYLDERWTLETITAGIDAWEAAFGAPPPAISWARGWSSTAVLELLSDREIALDMSVFPGRDASNHTDAIDVLMEDPNLEDVPVWPYYPSADDWRVEADAPGDGAWIFPFSTTAVDAWTHPVERLGRKLVGRATRSRVEHNYLFAAPRHGFLPYVDALVKGQSPYLTLSARSSVFLRKTSDDLRKCFTALDKVRGRHGCVFSDPITIRDAFAS